VRDVQVGTELVELVLARRSTFAQAEEAIGELFSVTRREEGQPSGYGYALSPHIAQRVAIRLSAKQNKSQPIRLAFSYSSFLLMALANPSRYII